MKYESLAKEILEKVGGKENVSTLVHCMTRLRFNLKDDSKANANTVKQIEGVIDVIEKGGQFQVVIGTHVADVYEEVVNLGGIGSGDASSTEKKTDSKWYKHVLDTIAGSFAPVIGAVAGAGMLKVILLLLTMTGVLSKDSQTYYVLNYVSDTAFYFLPFLLAYGASLKFKTSTALSLVMAGILLHPSYSALNTGEAVSFMGIPMKMVYYSSSVLPILLIVWIQSYVERFAKKISPNCVKVFLVPLITILVMTPLALCALGPIGGFLGDYMAAGFGWLNQTVPWLAPCLMGATTPLLVLTGMHYSLAPIGMSEFMTFGYGTFMTSGMVVSNIAQGVASFVVSLRTKDKNLKQVAGSSAITGVMGITEPALYGVNLPLKYPLISALIGGGCAGLYAGLTGVKSYSGGSQGLPALPAFFGGEDPMANFMNACIMIAISIVVTFISTWVLGTIFDKKATKNSNVERNDSTIETNDSTPSVDTIDVKEIQVTSPLKGEIVALSNVQDPVFAQGMMGKGIAIEPTEGKVRAPFNGKVLMVFNTNHAIGLVDENGIEFLIHIGMDTVELKGKGFKSHVQAEQVIKAGDVLIEFDIDLIKEAGYSTITPIVITNSDACQTVEPTTQEHIEWNQPLFTISK